MPKGVYKKTKEHIQKIAFANRNRHVTEETKQKISASNKGRIPWNFRKHLSEEHRHKISEAGKNRRHSEETKRKISESNKGKHFFKHTEATKRKIATKNKNKKFTEDHKRKIAESMKGKNKGKICSKRTRQKLSNAMKGRKLSRAWKKKISIALTGMPRPWIKKGRFSKKTIKKLRKINKALWQDPIYVKKVFSGLKVRPTKPEIQVELLLNALSKNEYKYVGNGQLVVGGKCPDFMNVNGKKKLIEVYGDYWHRNDNPQDRINLFKKYGYDTLVIWERELKNLDTLKVRLQKFMVKDTRKRNNMERSIKCQER